MSNLKALRSLSALGQNLRQTRLASRFSIAELATCSDVSERTLIRLEKGDAGGGIGNLAAVLAALGSPEVLGEVMAIENDTVGLSRALEAMPKRGRSFKPRQHALQGAEPQFTTTGRKGIAF